MDGGFYSYGEPPGPEELVKFDLNDFGNGLRLIRMVGGTIEDDYEVDAADAKLLYVLGHGWIGYNGKHWDRDRGDDLARQAAHRVATAMRQCYTQLLAKGLSAKDALKFIDGCGSSGATTAMLRQAQSYLTVRLDEFDRDPLKLNCRNGTLKMRFDRECEEAGAFSVTLLKHAASDRITRMTDAEWPLDEVAKHNGDLNACAAAMAKKYIRVLHHSIPDLEERAHFHRFCGYSTTGCTEEQALLLCQGQGRDGKSTLLDACRDVLGGYGETASPLTFLDTGAQSGAGPSPDLVKLSGDTRFVVLSEPKLGLAWNEGLLKSWTSGSPVTARDLNAKPFSFRPKAKLIVEMNRLPPTKGDDDGIWRRFITQVFRVQVPKPEVDKTLGKRILETEREGVLVWLVAGVGAWLDRGIDTPDSLTKFLEDYRRTSSPFGDWITERCIYGAEAKDPKTGEMFKTLSKELYDDYKDWATEQGHEKFMTIRAFGDSLAGRHVGLAGKDPKGRIRRGPIRLRTPEELEKHIAADNTADAGSQESAAGFDAGSQLSVDDPETPDWSER